MYKRIICSAVLAIMIAVASTAGTAKPRQIMVSEIPAVNTVEGLKMELEYDTYPGDVREMDVTFANDTGEMYGYSEEVYIETEVDGVWYVSWLQMSVRDLGHEILPGGEGTLPIRPMDQDDKGLVKGSYRVVLVINNRESSEKVYLADYFEVK